MKHLFITFLLATSGMLSNAQNVVYDENAVVRTVGTFNAVEVSGTVSLYLSQGTTQGVAVSAGEAKYNNKIISEVKNGVLHISVDGGVWNGFNWSNKKLKAYITVTELTRLEASGATYISTAGAIKSDDLKIEVSGASEMKGEIDAKKLAIDISGASVVKLSGKASDAYIEASGACVINAYSLTIDNCKTNTSGASSVRVYVKNQLTAEATGGSSIHYKGRPTSTNLTSSGGSNIKNKSDE